MAKPAPPPEDFPTIRFAERQKYLDSSYFFDNATRREEGGLILQRTLAGSAFYDDAGGRVAVRADQAMLFAHGEDSRYGIGPREERPYVTEFLHLVPLAGVDVLFARIRRDFGSVVRMSERGEAARLARETVGEFACGRAPGRLDLAERAYRLLFAVYREQMVDSRGHDPVAFGRHLLEERFRSPLNLKEWAEEIGLSREHFSRAFLARYGENPADFLRRLRLGHARQLLRSSSLPVEEVSALSGFSSAQTFRRAYRRHFGEPAGQGRR
jgi:AraC-like DNA-binding protein